MHDEIENKSNRNIFLYFKDRGLVRRPNNQGERYVLIMRSLILATLLELCTTKYGKVPAVIRSKNYHTTKLIVKQRLLLLLLLYVNSSSYDRVSYGVVGMPNAALLFVSKDDALDWLREKL